MYFYASLYLYYMVSFDFVDIQTCYDTTCYVCFKACIGCMISINHISVYLKVSRDMNTTLNTPLG